jgi:hypothetical protein
MTGPMTGIDLSPKMVELAQQRGNYSQTFVHDLEVSVPCPDRSVSDAIRELPFTLILAFSSISLRALVLSNWSRIPQYFCEKQRVCCAMIGPRRG